jgi:tetratricopeptide (TPR) repeat protein
MNTTQNTSSKIWFQYGLVGFLVGICLVSFSAVGLFAVEIANPPPTPTLLPTATVPAQALLDQAYEALYTNGNPQFVVDTLGPHLEEFSNPDELSKALEYMAMAEIGLGHYQLSAAYLERLIQISPTPTNYGMLARIYDSGGDLEHALANYLIYLESDDPNLTDDVRQMVQERVNQIQAILTSFTPTPGS